MKQLYIIGNGFDIFTGLHTSYRDFRNWLKNHYVTVYEALTAAYGKQNADWWNNFEVSLGKLDIRQYVQKYKSIEKSDEEILKEIQERRDKEKTMNLPPSLHVESSCAKRLTGLLDIIGDCLQKWIESMIIITNPKYVSIEWQNSLFLSFNYTQTLESIYQIPKENILHIHGCAFDDSKLVFGHNTYHRVGLYAEEEDVGEALDLFYKNPYEYIFKNEKFFRGIKEVDHVHVYGLSFSPVDIDYLNWVYDNISSKAQWEVSWYSEGDKQRINLFALDHKDLKNRLSLIRLDEIQLKKD